MSTSRADLFTPTDHHVLASSEPTYPQLLGEIYDPPECLHVRGADVALLNARLVAIVGSRSCSGYGLSVARSLARGLAAAGAVVVSGLAKGIDSAAHQGALEANGATIAVLGCGIDVVYPARNRRLAQEIRQTGLLVSEYPGSTPAAPWRFPARNRIIAGVSCATIVVEARERSGALITADFALEAGREVFAVPGAITAARSNGTNALIRNGATPVVSVSELLIDLEFEPPPRRRDAAGSSGRVLDAVADGATTLDELGRALDLGQAELSIEVTALELAGRLEVLDGHFRLLSD